MLRTLHVTNYVLIDSLEISFPEGLVIITGQTGAGKSILLGALSLVTGAKADASVISEGADNCVVEAVFDVSPDSEALRKTLEENEVEWEGGHLTIRRVIHSSGRSRSFVNDTPVPVSVLSDISSRIIDIHSQHRSLLLADSSYQLSVLDHFAGNADLLKRCSQAWHTLQTLNASFRDVESRLKRLEAEGDYNKALYRQLESAGLREGELEELEEEQRRLANAEQIKEDLGKVERMLSSDENPISALMKESSRLLSRQSKFAPSLELLSERLDSARIEIEDILEDVNFVNASLDASPQRLQTVEERLSLLYGLMRRHSCRDVAELIAVRDSLSGDIADISGLTERKATLEAEIKEAQNALDTACSLLSKSRTSSAPALAENITDSLHFLELEKAVFSVDVVPSGQGPSGSDGIVFRFSATGKKPVDVAKCASGGELSRIMLCLKDLMARYTEMPTMIFDEIDTGVSGSTADKMGSMICSMGARMQVFAITHLPQVAAKGDAHYLVSKEEGERTISSITRLEGNDRVMEIARMLSGSSVTEAAVANAKSLLQ